MKNTLKRLFCLLMVLTMVCALVACDEKEITNRELKGKTTLVGEWVAEVDMASLMSEKIEELTGMPMEMDDFTAEMVMTFNEDGTFEVTMKTDTEDLVDNLVNGVWNWLVDYSVEESGLTVSEVEEALEASGITKETLEMAYANVDFEDLWSKTALPSSGEWVLEDDKLYIAQENPRETEPITIERDGDEFSIVEVPNDESGYADLMLPIVFERL